ncbi:hypothetical protein WA171_006729 [Blastocystis sp. BT1]
MKVCICLGSVIDVNIRSDQTVMEAKGVIGVSQGTNPSSIKLIYKGHLLQNNHHLYYYGINNDSVIHMVISEVKDTEYQEIMQQESVSSCEDISSAGNESDTSDSVLESIAKHLFGDDLQLLYQSSAEVSYEVIHNAISSHPNIVKIAIQSPLVKDIISDINIVRSCIQTHPMIVELEELNPSFRSYLENDKNLEEIISLLQDSNSYVDFKKTRQVIQQKVESYMGKALIFKDKNVWV